jgi:uncharacterized GH25 family protein
MRRSWLALFLVLCCALAAPAAGQEIAVGGQALDPEGKPAAGVGVELIEVPSPFAHQQLQLQGKSLPDPVKTAKTDAQGRFRLSAPRPGMWTVLVRERGYLPTQMSLTPLLEPTELPPLTLARDKPLAVRILDRQGRPVAGARVLSQGGGFGRSFYQGWTSTPHLAMSAEDGTVTVPRGSRSMLTLRAVSPAHPEARLEVEPSRSSVELRLAAGCERTVEVQDPKRQPVAGALVQAGDWPLGLTDAAGRLAVAAPCDRELPVTAETADGRRVQGRLRPVSKGTAPAPERLPLPAQPDRLSGRVLDGRTRQPVAAALVWPGDAPGAFVRTDAAGSYTVNTPAWREAGVQAAALLYLPADARTGPPAPGVQPGPTLALQPQATLTGVVVDKAGKPVAGAALQADPAGGRDFGPRMSLGRPITALSDAAGKFQMRLSPEQDYTLKARHDDFSPAQRQVAGLRPRETKSGLRVVLDRGLSAFGQVVDVERRPVAGAQVGLTPADSNAMDPFTFFETQEPARPVSTDAQGRFRMEHLAPGSWSLQVEARGFAPMTIPGLDIQEGGARDLGTVILHPGVTLQGRVVDPRDRPVEGVEVRHSSGGMRGFTRMLRQEEDTPIFSAVDGLFAIPDLRPGDKLFLVFGKQGYATTELEEVEVPQAETLRVVLKPGSRVAGRVVDEAGEPVAQARVSLQMAGTQLVFGGGGFGGRSAGSAVTETDGSFSIPGVEAGKVTLTASASGFLAKEMTALEVPAGRDLEGLEVVLGRGAVVVGRVFGPGGSPVADAQVEVLPPAERGFRARFNAARASTDGDGNYRLEAVPEGPVSIAASHAGYQRAVKDLDVQKGENRADLRLEEGAEVSGRVVDSSGQPVEGARVVVKAPNSRSGFIVMTRGMSGPPQARTGADGSFRIPNVADGSYEVEADKSGYASAILRDVQVSGPVRGLELRLESGGVIRGRILGLELPELGDVSVRAFHLADRAMRSGQVDFKGEYRIEGLTEGEWSIAASTGSDRGAQGKATVTAGAETVLDLEFGGGLMLTGRVLRGGEPLTGAMIFASGGDVDEGGMGRTGPQGAFRIEGLKPGTYDLTLTQFEKGLEHHERGVEVRGNRDITIEIASQRVSGSVVDGSDLSPLEGAMVTIEDAQPAEGRRFQGFQRGSRSDANGAFSITDVGEGSYRVKASKEGYAPAESTVQIGAGTDVDDLRLSLSPTQGLTFEVQSASGGRFGEVHAALVDGNGRAVTSGRYTAGENGRVRVSTAPPGQWRLLVSAPGTAVSGLDVTVPGEPVRVVLSPGATLVVKARGLTGRGRLTVTGADGQPFRDVSGGMVLQEWTVFSQGVVDGLPAGTWQLTVTGPDGRVWRGSATTTPGGRAEVTLE